MSLDINLIAQKKTWVVCHTCRHGQMKNKKLFELNIISKLIPMAKTTNLYNCLWYPEKLNIKKAKNMIQPLTTGLKKLDSDPKYYTQLNPTNGWEDFTDFITSIKKYLEACNKYPNAKIKVYN